MLELDHGLQRLNDEFQTARPFPHVVVDGAFHEDWLDAIAEEFPPLQDPRWTTYPAPEEIGKRAGAREMWRKDTTAWFEAMQSDKTCRTLETLTGFENLTPDLLGGGMHLSGEGARLADHVDFSLNADGTKVRKLNVLLFLNKNWKAEDGGVLWLSSTIDGVDVKKPILPEFNRLVIFETSNTSWHGHPDPIKNNVLRKSLALYYYVPVTEHVDAHSTIWRPVAA